MQRMPKMKKVKAKRWKNLTMIGMTSIKVVKTLMILSMI